MVQQFFAFHLATISWVQNSSMNPKRREDISTSSCRHNNVLWCNRSNSMAYWGFVMYLLVSLVPPFRFSPDLLHVSCVLPGPASAQGLCSPGDTVQEKWAGTLDASSGLVLGLPIKILCQPRIDGANSRKKKFKVTQQTARTVGGVKYWKQWHRPPQVRCRYY